MFTDKMATFLDVDLASLSLEDKPSNPLPPNLQEEEILNLTSASSVKFLDGKRYS